MSSESLSLGIIVVCIIMSAYFSATETAFSSLNRIRVKNMAEKGNKKAELVMRLSENYDSLLSTILIGNNIVNITSASVATVLFVKLLGEEAGPSISTIVTTIVVLIFGEVSPKSIAKESPERFAMFSAPFLRVLMIVMTPFNFLFKKWKGLLSAIIKSDNKNTITEEELLTIVEEAEQEGGIDKQESSLIRSAIEFADLRAEDILTPRIDICAVSVNMSEEEIAEVFRKTAYSRLPIYEENIDHICGIIYHKDFYNYVYHKDREITSIIHAALFIAKNKKIDVLLRELQQKKLHIAVVLDEYGGTKGIVTLEDILEELVGEIWDEHDDIVEDMKMMSENEYVISGAANIEKVLEELEKEHHYEDISDAVTVSGWVMEIMGKIPEKGDSFQYRDFQGTILEMDGRRVGKIHMKRK